MIFALPIVDTLTGMLHFIIIIIINIIIITIPVTILTV